MLEVLSSLVTRVLEPSAGDEAGDDEEDEEEDVIMDIGEVGDCVVEQAIALLNDKECVAFLVRVAETSIEQTSATFSGERDHLERYVNVLLNRFCLSSNMWKSSLIFSLSEKSSLNRLFQQPTLHKFKKETKFLKISWILIRTL